jgi:osmoprotectant transport system permease protein
MRDKPLVDWAWVADHLDEIVARSIQHLGIALIAVAAGFAISLVVGVAVARRPRASATVMGFFGVLYTIPSIAAFAALVPVTGLSLLTALIPLTAYTLLILLRNIVAGIVTIPADILETADAMGYTGRARLYRIELPLATPLIIAGLRVASVSTIGLVTVAAIIGDNFGGLGVFINEGLRNFFPTAVYTGAVMSVVLAIAVDLVFVFVGNRLTPWTTIPDAEADGGAPVIPPVDPPSTAPTAPPAPTTPSAPTTPRPSAA